MSLKLFTGIWFLCGFLGWGGIPSHASAAYLASDVLGQLDSNDQPVFNTSSTNNGSSTVNSRGFGNNGGSSPVLDLTHHRLFITDFNNNRVLLFNLDSNNNLLDRVADAVLGQPNFVSSTAVTSTPSGMSGPAALAYDSARDLLFVSQFTGNRVLVFDTASITNGKDAIYVLGQPNFVSSTATLTQSGVSTPYGLTYDESGQRLFVGDSANNRVLVFDVASITNGENAVNMLGQTSFTSSTASTSQSGFSTVRGVLYDGVNDRLFTAENSNKRVLVFDVSSITNGENAVSVIGQADFVSSVSAAGTQNGLGNPYGLAYDSTNSRLFVGQLGSGTGRVTVYDVSTITNGENAIAILGRDSFADVASTNDVSQGNMLATDGMFFDPQHNRLYVGDSTFRRTMIFDLLTLPLNSLSVGSVNDGSYGGVLQMSNAQGTISFVVASGTMPTGLVVSTTTGAITGTPTTAGNYSFTIQATTDTLPAGAYLQSKSYSITIQPPTGGGGTFADYNAQYVPSPIAPMVVVPPIVLPAPQSTSEASIPASPVISSGGGTFSFTRTLSPGASVNEVQNLQRFLNTQGFAVASAGPGSPGEETSYFGRLTKDALIKFQEVHAKDILQPIGLTKGTGILGPRTRKFILENFR